MTRKLTLACLSIFLLASPLVASADMYGDLQAQIQSILLKLQQLQTESVVTSSQTFTASPTWGLAPLSVVFQQRSVSGSGSFAVDFGDGTGTGAVTCAPLAGSSDSVCRVTHAYTMPGVYSAQLLQQTPGNNPQWQATGKQVLFTVYKPTAGSAVATIDQRSLTTNSGNPTITGTASNADIVVWIQKGRVTVPSPIDAASQDYVWRNPQVLPVMGGRWSVQVTGVKLENGMYTVVVSNQKTGNVLSTGVLLVDTSR